jgi:hypothetical protein
LTAEDLFAIGLNETLNLHESYALLECMTPGQEIMLRISCVFNFLINTQNTEELLESAINTLKEAIAKFA